MFSLLVRSRVSYSRNISANRGRTMRLEYSVLSSESLGYNHCGEALEQLEALASPDFMTIIGKNRS